jgi:glycosyltransferase involved in cell wall biosynthesis
VSACRHFKFSRKSATISGVKITAAIIAFNEEKNIVDAIESVRWADEIIVVDSESTDRTRELAAAAGATVLVNPWPGFSAQKQFAVDHAENDWIFSLDADERVSDKLETEILEIAKSPDSADAYRIPRMSIYMGRRIRHGGWYPDWQLRLFDRRNGRWKNVPVHESVEMEHWVKVRKLSGDILHYSVEGPQHHHTMIGERYAPLAAEQMYANGRRTSRLKAVVAAWAAFIRAYFVKAGFLDGFPGFCIAYFAAHHALMKHLILLELQENPRVE